MQMTVDGEVFRTGSSRHWVLFRWQPSRDKWMVVYRSDDVGRVLRKAWATDKVMDTVGRKVWDADILRKRWYTYR